MPRASRYLLEGRTYHLTHRCHDRRFLLRFAAERDAYREWLRVGALRYGVAVYGYCVTGNHVHVIAHVHDCEAVAAMMRLASGSVAQSLNRRRGHEGSVWEHPYHCTMVEDGRHLLNCLRYVDLNMVRAGVVATPAQWRWCGYDEVCGDRQRYRIVDRERLAEAGGVDGVDALRELHRERLEDGLRRMPAQREPHWTDALAVGSALFVQNAQQDLARQRLTFVLRELEAREEPPTHVLQEPAVPYKPDSGAKSAF